MLAASLDNMSTASDKVLPRDWLPAVNDPRLHAAWAATAAWVVPQAALLAQWLPPPPGSATVGAGGGGGSGGGGGAGGGGAEGAGQGCRPVHAVVLGGIGVEALLLAAAGAAYCNTATEAAAAAVGAPGGVVVGEGVQGAAGRVGDGAGGPGFMRVTSLHRDQLSRALAGQLAGLNSELLRAGTGQGGSGAVVGGGDNDGNADGGGGGGGGSVAVEVRAVVMEEGAVAAEEGGVLRGLGEVIGGTGGKGEGEGGGGGATALVDAVVGAGHCTARLAVAEWAQDLQKVGRVLRVLCCAALCMVPCPPVLCWDAL